MRRMVAPALLVSSALLLLPTCASAQPPRPGLCPDLTGDALTLCLYSDVDDRLRELGSVPPTPTPTPTPDPTTAAPTPDPTTPTPDPTPDPTTPTPDPTTATPTPDPTTATPSPTATPAGFPNAANTGVPTGTTLRASGSITVSTPGAVVENLLVRGTINVTAPDVTIRNVRVETNTSGYPIRVQAARATIVDTEIDGQDGTGIGVLLSSGSVGTTLRRVEITGGEDHVRIGASNILIEDSWMHHLHRQVGGHHDNIQIRSGDNVTIRHNNLQAYVPETNDPMNAAIQVGSLDGTNQISNFRIVGNLLNGGNYTINGGRATDTDSVEITGNRFGRNFRYGPLGNIDAADTVLSDNVYDDNGQPVR